MRNKKSKRRSKSGIKKTQDKQGKAALLNEDEHEKLYKETVNRGKALCTHFKRSFDIQMLQSFLKKNTTDQRERPVHQIRCQYVGCDYSEQLWMCLMCSTIACGPPDCQGSHISKHLDENKSCKPKPHNFATNLCTFNYWCRICKRVVIPQLPSRRNPIHPTLDNLKQYFVAAKPTIKLKEHPNISVAKAVLPPIRPEELLPDNHERHNLKLYSGIISPEQVSLVKELYPDTTYYSEDHKDTRSNNVGHFTYMLEKLDLHSNLDCSPKQESPTPCLTTPPVKPMTWECVPTPDVTTQWDASMRFKNEISDSEMTPTKDSSIPCQTNPPVKPITSTEFKRSTESTMQSGSTLNSPQEETDQQVGSTLTTNNTRTPIFQPRQHTYYLRDRKTKNSNYEGATNSTYFRETASSWLDLSIFTDLKNVSVMSEDVDLVKCMQALTQEETGIRGLLNYGNTCFLNSVLQCLAQTPNFLSSLLSTSQGHSFSLPGDPENGIPCLKGSLESCGPVTTALIQTLAAIRNNEETSSIAPKNLISTLIAHKATAINFREQQDAMELLGYLITALEDEQLALFEKVIEEKTGKTIKKKCKEEEKSEAELYYEQATEIPFSVFHGCMCNTLVCQPCNNTKSNRSPFFSLSLPIAPFQEKTNLESKESKVAVDSSPKNDNSSTDTDLQSSENRKGKTKKSKKTGKKEKIGAEKRVKTLSIGSCLDGFIAEENLDGYNCNLCAENKLNNNESDDHFEAHFQVTKISTLPDILVLHLLRFYYDRTSLYKLRTPVSYPKVIDLAPYCVSSSQTEGGTKYSLYGIVNHAGNLNSGHYTAFVQLDKSFCVTSNCDEEHNTTGQGSELSSVMTRGEKTKEEENKDEWFKANDQVISTIAEEKVLENEAYILFYKRI